MPQEGPSKQRPLHHIGPPRAGSGPFMDPAGRRPRREQRFQSLQLGPMNRGKPSLLEPLRYQDGHARMPGLHKGVRRGGEHCAGIQLAAISTKPTLPQPGQPEHTPVGWPKTMPLLKKCRCGNQTAAMAPCASKTGLLRNGFRAGINGPRSLRWIFHPGGEQPPEQQSRTLDAFVAHQSQHRLRW